MPLFTLIWCHCGLYTMKKHCWKFYEICTSSFEVVPTCMKHTLICARAGRYSPPLTAQCTSYFPSGHRWRGDRKKERDREKGSKQCWCFYQSQSVLHTKAKPTFPFSRRKGSNLSLALSASTGNEYCCNSWICTQRNRCVAPRSQHNFQDQQSISQPVYLSRHCTVKVNAAAKTSSGSKTRATKPA